MNLVESNENYFLAEQRTYPLDDVNTNFSSIDFICSLYPLPGFTFEVRLLYLFVWLSKIDNSLDRFKGEGTSNGF
jgi:hypothetical protein